MFREILEYSRCAATMYIYAAKNKAINRLCIGMYYAPKSSSPQREL